MKEYLDIITRIVPTYGVLPIIKLDGVEVYRGEFCTTSQQAFDVAYAEALKKGYLNANT